MLNIRSIHHVAIICSDYLRSRDFYTQVLGFTLEAEHYRKDRDSWKADLSLAGRYALELFSFPSPPARVSGPEAAGLRHIAFEVDDVSYCVAKLAAQGIQCEDVRTDPYTGKRFTFFRDPDHLPLELYECRPH